jgi:dTMP kinase
MFITFEGIEGCGKTTQIRLLARKLEVRGLAVILTFEPGGTKIGNTIRTILLDSKNTHLAPLTELLLYEADRAQHMAEVIEPALAEGKWVLSDRFYDATLVYQGLARGQDMSLIRMLNEEVTGQLRPDRTFLLDCPVEIGLNRALKRNDSLALNGQARFEQEKTAFHQKVRQGYLDLANAFPERFAVIDASLAPNEVEEKIMEKLVPLLSPETGSNGPQSF